MFFSRRHRDPYPDSPDTMRISEEECQSPAHEEVDPNLVDGSVHMPPAGQLASLVEEETPTLHEDYMIMLGKRPACT